MKVDASIVTATFRTPQSDDRKIEPQAKTAAGRQAFYSLMTVITVMTVISGIDLIMTKTYYSLI